MRTTERQLRKGEPTIEDMAYDVAEEIERDMKLMGCTKISELNRNNLRFRNIK